MTKIRQQILQLIVDMLKLPDMQENPAEIIDAVTRALPGTMYKIHQPAIAWIVSEARLQGIRYELVGEIADPDPKPFRFEVYPTPHPFTNFNQDFGANPERYKKWRLPGHEGVDLFAVKGHPIYAVADGTVIRVEKEPRTPAQGGRSNYGCHVRILHKDGYKTVYAHMGTDVGAYSHVGQLVRAGDVIGTAASTGNSTAPHLHLTLKKIGASKAGHTNYPYDIIDPTPFLTDLIRGLRE